MKYFSKQEAPSLTGLPCWLFICEDDNDFNQVEAFVNNQQYFGASTYNLKQSSYIPAVNERLGGHSQKSNQALQPVQLLFLMKPTMSLENLPKDSYVAPTRKLYEKTRLYNETEYYMYPDELRMEFYLEVISLFCKKGQSIFLLYTGSKAVTASVVSRRQV